MNPSQIHGQTMAVSVAWFHTNQIFAFGMIRAKMFAKLFAACDKKVCFSFLFLSFFSARRFERAIRKRPNTARCKTRKYHMIMQKKNYSFACISFANSFMNQISHSRIMWSSFPFLFMPDLDDLLWNIHFTVWCVHAGHLALCTHPAKME